MILCDVNVLVYAHRKEVENHAEYRNWLESTVNSAEAFGVSELVLSRFVRVVTHPRIFRYPSPIGDALAFAGQLLSPGNAVRVSPGQRHWDIFVGLCRDSAVKGSLVADAYFAALAMEFGCEWITTDRDFSRFKGLRWRHPLA